MKAVIDELPALVRMQHRLVSLVGAIAHDGSSNRYDVALRTAEKTSRKFFLLPSPFLADSPEERRQWCRHRLYRAVETLAGQADVAFVGIGQMGIGCPMHREGFINEAVVNELVEVGAVGETLGWAFGRAGEPVRTSIHERVTSIQLRRPPKTPVIAFAAGESKPEAVLGPPRSLDKRSCHRRDVRADDPAERRISRARTDRQADDRWPIYWPAPPSRRRLNAFPA